MKYYPGNSLADQWLGLRALIAVAQVQSLVGELRSHKRRSVAKTNKQNQYAKQKNPDTKGHLLYDSFFMIHSEEANP